MNDFKFILVLNIIIVLFLLISFVLCEINDDFKSDELESSNSYLIDINDYHNLGLIMTTSKNIYFISSFEDTPPAPTNFILNVANYSMGATYDENYLLVACLEDSLLAKINIRTGDSSILLNYDDISYNGEILENPNQICSLSIFENIVYIAIANEYIADDITYNKYYVIKIKMKLENDEPIIDDSIEKQIYVLPDSYIKISALDRQISCEVINIPNTDNENRLVCIIEYITSGIATAIKAIAIKNDFSETEPNQKQIKSYSGGKSGLICFKYDLSIITCNMRKVVCNITLSYSNTQTININKKEYFSVSDSIAGFLYYVNNFAFSCYIDALSVYYIKIESTSNNYYIIYDLSANSGGDIKKLYATFDSTNKIMFCFYHLKDKIKYFSFNSDVINSIFNINSYSKKYRVTSNYNQEISLDSELVDITNPYGTCEIQKTLEYTDIDGGKTTFLYKVNNNDNNNFPYNKNTNTLTPPGSNNHWYQYNFAYIEDGEDFLRIVYLENINITLETCAYQCSECLDNYYTCSGCRNDYYSTLNGHPTDNNCYPIDQTFEGYIYDSSIKKFEKCYASCKFCSESVSENPSSTHKCTVCSDGYYPSYEYLGNCYKIDDNDITSEKYVETETDESFTTKSCLEANKNYKIDSTGECVSACPTDEVYFTYEYNYINFTEQTNEKITQSQYTFEKVTIPKYSFNNICYEECPINTVADSSTNICVCQYAWHQDTTTNKIICYGVDYCTDQNYRYYHDDTKECKQNGDSSYYQFNFECYKDGCPENTNENSHECESTFTYCYVNEHFKTICSNSQDGEYIYQYDNTNQYLKSCEESLTFTTLGSQTYLYNKKCILECPTDITNLDEANKKCLCKYYGYYTDDDDYICYREEEICNDKIPVIDINKCLDSVDDCINKGYKTFNNKCYTTTCPDLTEESSDSNLICKCKFAYYNNNNLLECFEGRQCENEYEYSNPETLECFSSLNDCFAKNNLFYYNMSCYKDNCPTGKISLSSINDEAIKNKIIAELSISNELVDHICVCDIINNQLNWNIQNITDDTFLQICVNDCDEQYEPNSLTRKCEEKCNISKHYIFNDVCYKEGCPEGSKLNESNPDSRVCICEKTTYIEGDTIICCDESEGNCPSLNLSNCPIDYKIYKNKCYSKCPDGTCLTQNDKNLTTCVNIESYMTVLNGICIENILTIIDSFTNSNKKLIQSISNLKGSVISGYFAEDEVYESSSTSNYSLLYLNECKDKLIEKNNLGADDKLFILQIESVDNEKNSAINSYNYGVFLENGTQLDLSACEGTKITLSSPIIDTESVQLDKAIYFSESNYDIYNESSEFYTDSCAPASISGNDITLTDRKTDFYPSNISLCNDSCQYSYVNLTTKRFICDCDIITNISEENENDTNIEDSSEDDSSYLDYFISLMNYKITKCYNLITNLNNFKTNIGFYLGGATFVACTISMIVFLIKGLNLINKCIDNGIPTKAKLLERMKQKQNNNNSDEKSGNPPKSSINIEIEGGQEEDVKEEENIENKIDMIDKKFLEQEEKNDYHYILKLLGKRHDEAFLKEKDDEKEKEIKSKYSKNNKNTKNTKKTKNSKRKKKKTDSDDENESVKKSKFYLKKMPLKKPPKENNRMKLKADKRETIETLVTKEEDFQHKMNNFNYVYKPIGFRYITEEEKKILNTNYKDLIIINDNVDRKELNNVPFSQALRIDNRSFFQIFLSVIAHKIEIISIFYYRSETMHISLSISIYIFSLLLDLTLNCFLYSDDVVSEKYHNDGKLEFATSFILSLMSNIFSAIIVYIIGNLTEFFDILGIIIRDVSDISHYYENIKKFKKIMGMKLTIFFIIQYIMIIFMVYYLSVFCIVFSKSQTSILLNYLYGVIESLAISLGIALVITIVRYCGVKCKLESFYNSSKYFYETF